MAPPVNHGALSREVDLRTLAYVVRFIDDHRGAHLDWDAQHPILTHLAIKYSLRPYVKGYQNDQYMASALHDKIITWLNTRKAARWKTKECKGDASVDKLFEIGSTMLEQKVRDQLAAAIQNLPATPTPAEPEDELTKAGVDEAEVVSLPASADDPSYRSRQPTKSSARSASQPKARQRSKPKSSRRLVKVKAGEIKDAEADEDEDDAENTATPAPKPQSRPRAIPRAQQLRSSRKQEAITMNGAEEDDISDGGEVVAFVPKRKIESRRIATTGPHPMFPNLSERQGVPGDEDGLEEDEMEVEGDSESGVESEDEDEIVVAHENGTISKKRGPGASFDESSRSRKKAKDSLAAPREAGAAKTAGRRSMQKEADSPPEVGHDLSESELEDQGEDEKLALQVKNEDYNKSIGEEDSEMADDEADLDTDEVEEQLSSPPRSASTSNPSGNRELSGLRDEITDDAVMPTSSRQPSDDQVQASLNENMMKLAVRRALLKVDNCLNQALSAAFTRADAAVEVASIVTEPNRSLKRLYIKTLGQGWLNLAEKAMSDNDAKQDFNALALLKALVWHYLESEILTQQVLSDTVYALLGKVRAHLEPVLTKEDVAYNTVFWRASEAQLQDAGSIKKDIQHCAHELKTKLMIILRPHLEEMMPANMPQNWRRDFSKSLIEVCHQAILLRAKLEMEENKHEVFVFNYPEKFDGKQMATDGGHEGVVMFTKMPGIKKVMAEGESDELIVKAVVVRYPEEMYD